MSQKMQLYSENEKAFLLSILIWIMAQICFHSLKAMRFYIFEKKIVSVNFPPVTPVSFRHWVYNCIHWRSKLIINDWLLS